MIVTITTITSTYWLNSGRKYRSSCHQSGIKKEKGKINKIIHYYFVSTL